MNKLLLYKFGVVGFSALAGVLLLTSTAFAVILPGRANSITSGAPVSSQKASAQTKLQTAKLKVCQARENGIKNRSTQLANLAKNMEDKFDAIAKRVQDYYTNTVVSSGKTVANYDSLVSDIQTKKTEIGRAHV